MANSNLSSKEIKSLMNLYAAELRKLQFQSRLTRNTITELKSDLAEVSAREAAEEKAKLDTLTQAAEAPVARGRKTTARKTKAKSKAKGRRGRPRKAAAPKAAPATTEAAATTEKAAAAPVAKKKGRGRPKGTSAKKTTAKKTTAKKTTVKKATAKKAAAPKKAAAKSTTTKSASAKKAAPAKKAPAKKAAAKKGAARKSGAYRPSEYDLLIFESLDKTGNAMIASEMQSFVETKFKEEGRKTSTNEVKTMITRSLQKLANRRKDLIKVRFEGRGFAYAQPKWVTPDGNLKKKYQR